MALRKRKAQLRTRAGKAAVGGYGAMDARLPVSELGRQLLRKAFPDHWSFLLGEIALYSFVVLLLTGVYLTLFFDPSMMESVYTGSYAPLQGVRMTQAYTTTLNISFDVRGGLLIRQIHHWAALLFVAAIAVHLLRIFFTGAFRKPREANWVVGVTLFVLALLEGFAGYSLPDDLLSGTGLRTAATIVGSIPVVGTYVELFVFGGQFPGSDVIPRLYAVHILLVPGLIVALITVHLMLVVHLKHTHWAAQGKTNKNAVGSPAFPQFTAKTTGFLLMVFGVLALLGGLAQINPVWNYGPYRADQVSGNAQPDWYVGFLEGALRLMPPWETDIAGHTIMWNVFIPTLVLPGVVFMALFLYPFFEKWVTGDRREHHLCDRPRNRPTRTGLGVAAIVFYAVLLVAGGNDVVAYSFRVSIEVMTWILRIALIAAPLLAFALTKRLCLALQMRDRRRLTEGEETGQVTQSVNGDLSESHRGLSPTDRYRILMRDVPTPLELPAEGPVSRRRRLRTVLSGWYYRDLVDLPVTDEQRSRIAERTAPPEPVREPED
ncbi:cytochrome bc complex cytochrome b subunit [Streptomyces sp. NBC_01762]|uniref:cytochrome bc1 complex cytochrome b subunit n=1 Tax=unclassified Streptomyces TaxID=2593676 RepID=UPI002DDA1E6B|nr:MULTISPECIES: cytochrome bc complex cytochrome b subunit [unclassified Streptomyces]WSC43650.1 cytochrome bc complex cytochrome b subunit [Streptomyces sp. NBC_01762]WSD23186.1 cytochrome bc complex cytochrome b subunit [Streptomyces sp. NBC_01751]